MEQNSLWSLSSCAFPPQNYESFFTCTSYSASLNTPITRNGLPEARDKERNKVKQIWTYVKILLAWRRTSYSNYSEKPWMINRFVSAHVHLQMQSGIHCCLLNTSRAGVSSKSISPASFRPQMNINNSMCHPAAIWDILFKMVFSVYQEVAAA